MQIILSPAKLMDFSGKTGGMEPSKPLFAERTEELIAVCRRLSEREIATEMEINAKKAREVYEYFQTFDLGSTPEQPAALAYNGIAYKGLNAHDFSAEDFDFAQRHLNIISGLYGIVRPLDAIKPYRLEMQRKIVPRGYHTLYDFWGDTVNDHLSKKLRKGDKTIINVASKEYAKVVRKNKLPKGAKIIDIQFLQQENDALKQIVVHSKKARGLMSRFIIKNRLIDPEEVKAFDYEGYFFYPALSKEDTWVFVR
ncbi:YaaA family protein [Proteiniphilum sp. X52]|uniref:YaaA family protein n=1 Tax=Proteiniphilum sp. X52 TaxID=2382159 RepID=UPI000F0A091D|nr:YaaA family protein [Proteiniphilum sp. X52]RNC66267.1 YaaA family protein [Proteiniphilum sp. X52]